ncbi:MAG: ACT domain-containing protein [Oscillospiraceae bacterium]|nr:ACT domain-containing protein [Oscillospiraceae bacterium]
MASEVKQLSVFVENKPGRLSAVLKVLGDSKIDIRAMNIADTNDFGILRLILSDTEGAVSLLKEKDYAVAVTDVIALDVDDTPGGLAGALSVLDKSGVSVEYMYASLSNNAASAHIVLRVDDNAKAEDALASKGYKLLSDEDIKKI